MGENSSQRRKTEDTKTRTQDHELAIETDRKIPGQENSGKAMDAALAKQKNRVGEDIEECMAPDRRTAHRESTAERNRQE
ncbi:hypothetical protein ACHAQK_000502, partial [Fusarium lateritium]